MRQLVSQLALSAAALGLVACGDDGGGGPANVLIEQCGLECKGFADAGGSISGIRGVDAFFSAVLGFEAQAGSLNADVRTELAAIAVALGATVEADASISELQASIQTQIQGGIGGRIEGGLEIAFVPPRCEVSASASVQAAARCDVDVDPGAVSVMCEGSCEVDASVMATCEGGATIECRGTAPEFDCTGSCQGTCALDPGGAECSGTCMGTCMLETAAVCEGNCTGTEAGGMCTGGCEVRAGGTCNGTCMGMCELTAPEATCNGECRGECTYTPASASCEADARVRCEASGNASVMCQGMCSGMARPPSVDAECEATVEAEAQFNAECTPPDVEVKYQLSAAGEAELEGNVAAQAMFDARIRAVGRAFANIQARGAKVTVLIDAGAGLVAAGQGAVTGALDAVADGDFDLALTINAGCALDAVANEVPGRLTSATTDLQEAASGVAMVTASLAGSTS